MTYADTDSLVSTEWLAQRLEAPDIRIVDGSFKLPGLTPTAREEYLQRHLPGAVFFDLDEIADERTPLPNMLPSAEAFAARVRRLGLGNSDRIVAYDAAGLMSAARVWWMFRVFGHRDVAILDGGLPKWSAEGRPLTDQLPMPCERHFTARPDYLLVREKEQIWANLASQREQVLDARAQGRFEASADEFWPGRRRGHNPGSLNLPYDKLVDPKTRTVRPAAALKALFEAAGVDLSKPVICSCGSGVTASALAFGLHLLGHQEFSVYDGSWAEWGLPGDTPVETGPAQR